MMSAEEMHKKLLESTPSGRALLEHEELLKEATKEMQIEELSKILGTTIMEDETNRVALLLLGVLNYTYDEQQNIGSSGPSSSGKSYLSFEIIKYFPEEDVLALGYTSPTAFWHENSNLCTENGTPLEPRSKYIELGVKEWEEQNPRPVKGEGRVKWDQERKQEERRLKTEWEELDKFYIVNLEGKFLLFIDQPHDQLLQNLRPILSHDKKQIEIIITDKTKEGGNRTKRVIVVGFPTVFFNSTSYSVDEQERTRFWLFSPEISQTKLQKSLELQSKVLTDKESYSETLAKDKTRKMLMLRLREIRNSSVRNVIISENDRVAIYNRFLKEHKTLSPRHQRDFPRLIALIKAHALFNQFNRSISDDGTSIHATVHDVNMGYQLYKKLANSNELGIPPHIYQLWSEALEKTLLEHPEGLSRKDLSKMYYDFYHTRISKKGLRNIVELLEEVGLIVEENDPNDRRQKRIYHHQYGGEISDKKGGLDEYTG